MNSYEVGGMIGSWTIEILWFALMGWVCYKASQRKKKTALVIMILNFVIGFLLPIWISVLVAIIFLYYNKD